MLLRDWFLSDVEGLFENWFLPPANLGGISNSALTVGVASRLADTHSSSPAFGIR